MLFPFVRGFYYYFPDIIKTETADGGTIVWSSELDTSTEFIKKKKFYKKILSNF